MSLSVHLSVLSFLNNFLSSLFLFNLLLSSLPVPFCFLLCSLFCSLFFFFLLFFLFPALFSSSLLVHLFSDLPCFFRLLFKYVVVSFLFSYYFIFSACHFCYVFIESVLNCFLPSPLFFLTFFLLFI